MSATSSAAVEEGKAPPHTTPTTPTSTSHHPNSLPKRPWRLYVTPYEAIRDYHYAGSGTEEDPFMVEWMPEDPENPQSYPESYKWALTLLVASTAMGSAMSSSGFSGGIDNVKSYYPGYSEVVYALGTSLFVLGYAIGPLAWAPLSELYGKRVVFTVTAVIFATFQGCTAASQNFYTILVMRLMAGLFGANPLVNAGGVIADIMPATLRGKAMAFYAAAPYSGPAIGPIAGGYISTAANWRWVEGFLGLFTGFIACILFMFLPETYGPTLLRKRAELLSTQTGQHYQFKLDKGRDMRALAIVKTALSRPFILLIHEPIVVLLAVYVAILYGILYSFFDAFPIVFGIFRGWSPGKTGLSFLGILTGTVTAVLYVLLYENPRYVRACGRHGGKAPPEERLYMAMLGGVCVVIGLAWFAATDGPSIHFLACIFACVPFGFGFVLVFLSATAYLTDSYVIFASAVLASNTLVRSSFGFFFPLIGPFLYRTGGSERLGIHWGPAIDGFMALACLPFPFIFFKFGPRIRAYCKYSSQAKAILEEMNKTNQAKDQIEEEKREGTIQALEREPVNDSELNEMKKSFSQPPQQQSEQEDGSHDESAAEEAPGNGYR